MAEYQRLAARLAGRSLVDALEALLVRRGFALPAVDPAQPEAVQDAVREARLAELARIYREAEQHYELFLLAENLVEYDEMLVLWRTRHVHMVERIIGGRMGTGGSSGAQYLRSTLDRRCFPELWALRGYLSVPA